MVFFDGSRHRRRRRASDALQVAATGTGAKTLLGQFLATINTPNSIGMRMVIRGTMPPSPTPY
jgi:hypothetical protein